MIDLELFFNDRPAIPDWFKTHPIFKEIKQVNKIFPSIGLSNFTYESNLESNNTSALIKSLCSSISSHINNVQHYFESKNIENGVKTNKFAPASKLLNQFYKQVSKPRPFIAQFAEKQGLYLQQDIIDSNKKIFAKNGESLFKVYAKLVEFVRKHYNYALPALDTIPAFKEYSSNNFNGKLNVVFSADGSEGAWDILTMSQRGINSCQSWHGQYKNCTIGSVIDPFTAIIYLTSGSKTEFGSKMIRRCIVRFAVDSFMKRPCIFMEYMYPGEHAATMKAFKDAIRSKIGDRFPIVSQHNSSSERYYVPCSETSKLLLKHSNASYVNRRGSHNYYGIFPYRDTFMEYKIKEEKTSVAAQMEQCKNDKLLLLYQKFQNNSNISENYISIIKSVIGSETFDKISLDTCNDTTQYLRVACIKYFASKNSITQALTDKINAEMKTHKDKSIFIPGIENIEPTPKKKGTANGETKKAKAVPAMTVKDTVKQQVIPLVSEVFKSTWENIVGVKVVKARTKVKTKKIKLN